MHQHAEFRCPRWHSGFPWSLLRQAAGRHGLPLLHTVLPRIAYCQSGYQTAIRSSGTSKC
jgi:hypothetical protein